jgi:hypothetical protein
MEIAHPKRNKRELCALARLRGDLLDKVEKLTGDSGGLGAFIQGMALKERGNDRVVVDGYVEVGYLHYEASPLPAVAYMDKYQKGMLIDPCISGIGFYDLTNLERWTHLPKEGMGLVSIVKAREIESAADVLPLDWYPDDVRDIRIQCGQRSYLKFNFRGEVYALTGKVSKR